MPVSTADSYQSGDTSWLQFSTRTFVNPGNFIDRFIGFQWLDDFNPWSRHPGTPAAYTWRCPRVADLKYFDPCNAFTCEQGSKTLTQASHAYASVGNASSDQWIWEDLPTQLIMQTIQVAQFHGTGNILMTHVCVANQAIQWIFCML